MIDISIIIPVYNPGELIKRCLDSILAQKGSYTYEVLMVDDGCKDNSLEIINGYQNPAFRLMHQENAGPAKARNKALSEARGKYVCYIDADDYWMDEYIEKTITFLNTHEECIAVTVGQNHKTVSGEHKNPINWLNEQEPFVINDFFGNWAENQFVGTCSTTMRTDIVRKTGGQRADLRISEDWEFWFLLATCGKWGFIPEIMYVSDGTDLIKGDGWLKKMEIRWQNAPSISDWEKRIVAAKPELCDDEGYRRARGRISRNLTYCQLLSGRLSLSRQEALKYGKYFTKDAIGRLMNMAKYSSITWWALAKFLRYREYHRK